MRDERTNIEDRVNQPMEAGDLVSQLHVGVLNGKYDLAGSELKIWPSNYDLELNLERKNKKLSSALPRQMIHIQIIIWAKF